MFPTANSTIYRNEDGEVIGWETVHDDAPEPEDFYAADDGDPEEFDTRAECEAAGVHGDDGHETAEGVWICERCDHPFTPRWT